MEQVFSLLRLGDKEMTSESRLRILALSPTPGFRFCSAPSPVVVLVCKSFFGTLGRDRDKALPISRRSEKGHEISEESSWQTVKLGGRYVVT